jgi:[acyl-carrier-protein] S-malonyltransferase
MKAFIFPGQGKSVAIGMGRSLSESFAEAKEVFQEVDDALQLSLSKIMWGEDERTLSLTENAQPALMAVGVALARVLVKQSGQAIQQQVNFVAGHSLGEYTALTATGMFTLADAAKMLRIRGASMQLAVKPGIGAMAALLGCDIIKAQQVIQLVQGKGVLEISNDNASNQIVVSGHKDAVDALVSLASDHGIKRAILLPVSAPFHCSLMQPAADKMAEVFKTIRPEVPSVPIISNVTAAIEQDPQRIMQLLVEQVTKTVRWRESVDVLVQKGVNEFIELGSGKVLSGLVRQATQDAKIVCLHDPQEIEDYLT